MRILQKILYSLLLNCLWMSIKSHMVQVKSHKDFLYLKKIINSLKTKTQSRQLTSLIWINMEIWIRKNFKIICLELNQKFPGILKISKKVNFNFSFLYLRKNTRFFRLERKRCSNWCQKLIKMRILLCFFYYWFSWSIKFYSKRKISRFVSIAISRLWRWIWK